MFNPKFTLQSDFVDSYVNRILLETKSKDSQIHKDALVFEACVNLNRFCLNFSECGEKRDKVEKYLEENNLQNEKESLIANCGNELLESHSLIHLQHRDNFSNMYSKLINNVAIKDSMNSLFTCISKI